MDGFFNLIKPPGMSSGAAVSEMKRLTGEKCGHAGTLDPEAAGVLPIMTGRATRLLDYFSSGGKEYIAEIAFTGSTDTQDAQGVLTEKGAGVPSREELLAVLPRFTGEIMQRPPAYSALKRNGVPLYRLARAGETVVTEGRKTMIDEIRVIRNVKDGFLIRVSCGGGTYIRTLCHDIGNALGKPAHMRFLLRTRVGAFDIGTGITLEEAKAARAEGCLEKYLLPCDFPLAGIRRLDVPAAYRKQAVNGVPLPAELTEGLPEGERCLIILDGVLLGVSERTGEVLRPRAIIRDHSEFS